MFVKIVHLNMLIQLIITYLIQTLSIHQLGVGSTEFNSICSNKTLIINQFGICLN